MEKHNESNDTLIELGVASEETQGGPIGPGEAVGRFKLTGLSDD